MTYRNASYYKNEDGESTEYPGEYRNWLKKHFNLDAIDEEDIVLAPAIAKYQGRLDDWMGQYLG